MTTDQAPTSLIAMPKQRIDLALQAVLEIDALMEVAIRHMGPHTPDLAVRGICMRSKQLSTALMFSLDATGSDADLEESYLAVHGESMPDEEIQHG